MRLARIGDLYAVEHRVKDENLDREQIRTLRQKESRPILEEMEKRMEQWASEALPKSPMGRAIGYARGQWQA